MAALLCTCSGGRAGAGCIWQGTLALSALNYIGLVDPCLSLLQLHPHSHSLLLK